MIAKQTNLGAFFLPRDDRVPSGFDVEPSAERRQIDSRSRSMICRCTGSRSSSSDGSAHCTGVPTER